MKGIAITTILKLLVGILVVAVIVYMVYRYFIGAPLSEQECRARAISWCTSCKNANVGEASWVNVGPSPPNGLVNCAKIYFEDISGWDCTDAQVFCTAFIPTT